jgi:pilus assembly protein Flp/PilA
MMWISVKFIDAKDRLVKATKKFVTGKEEGASAVEYGLLVALIAAVIVTVVKTLGTKVQNGFNQVNNQLP